MADAPTGQSGALGIVPGGYFDQKLREESVTHSDRIEREHRIIKVCGPMGYIMGEPCGCREFCGDFTDDDEGTCISLPRVPEPLVELALVDRRTGERVA